MAQDPDTILSLERQAVVSLFDTAWPATEPNVPVRYPNLKWTMPSTPWLWFNLVFGAEEQVAHHGDSTMHEALSLVLITVMSPEQSNTDAGLLLLSKVMGIYRRKRLTITGGGSIKFNRPFAPPPPQLDAGWWTQAVQLGFQSMRFYAL